MFVVFSTHKTKKLAKDLAKKILLKKLASCVQIKKISSLYLWKGELCEEGEFGLSIKTKKALYKKLEKFIKKNHSYETPQIIAFKVKKAEENYSSWSRDVLD